MSKKASRGAGSKISSVTSSATQKSQKSSIQKSAFAPSHLQLALFASVIQGLDSQHLRIHDTNTGRLRCEYATTSRTKITSLEWGYYGASYQESLQQGSNKKRKRNQSPGEHAVVAYGTSDSEICMFSPAEGKVVGKLGGVHDRGIKDFKFFAGDYLEGWSIGGDGKLVLWDLTSDEATRTISLPDPTITVLASPIHVAPQLLCASLTPFSITLGGDEQPLIESFDSFINPVHSLIRSGTDSTHKTESFLASDHDRTITVFDLSQKKLVRTLLAESEAKAVDFYTPTSGTKHALSGQVLAVVTKAGLVELFAKPFCQTKPLVNGDLKSKKPNAPIKASAKVQLVRADSSKTVPIFNASFQGPELLVAITEGGVDVTFQKIRWQDDGNGELLFDGVKEVRHSKSASTLNTATMNGVKEMGKSNVDESKAVVVNGATNGSFHVAAIEISSSEDEDEDEVDDDGSEDAEIPKKEAVEMNDSDDSDEDSDEDMLDAPGVTATKNDQEMILAGDDKQEDSEKEEPSFGELLAKRHPNPISIANALQLDSSTVQIEENRALSLPSGVSLSTVLTQALRTNDQNLLESCLHVTGTDIIKLTIQRLDSSLAGILLQKLAERLASKPGRFGHLIDWAQWTCIAHGGAIAGRPDVLSKVGTLYKVLTQRAKSLDSLLLLKGKLDMLDAQLTFRREVQAQRGAKRPAAERGVIFVEDNDNWSSDEDEAVDTRAIAKKTKKPKKALNELVEEDGSSDDSSEDEDDEMPTTNGNLASDSDSDSDSEAEPLPQKAKMNKGKAGILDLEAEDSHPSDDEEDDSEEEEDSDEADSEMEGFINDDSIEEEEDEDDDVVEGDDSPDETPEKPARKKSKRA